MPSFVLELEVSFSQKLLTEHKNNPKLTVGGEVRLKRMLDTAAALRNTAKSEALKRLHKVRHDRRYQALQAEYARRKRADRKADVSDLSKGYREVFARYGYTEYSIQEYLKQARDHYRGIVGSQVCQNIASQAFRAVDKIRTGESGKVSVKSRTADTSAEGKTAATGIAYIGDACIRIPGRHVYPLIVKKNDTYAPEALRCKVKYVRLVRRTIRGRQRYFAQLVMEGVPPRKKSLVYGSGRVGLDEGVSTIAVVSDTKAELIELAPGTAADEKELRRLNRAIDRSMRANNPGNYNHDGTVKKGRHTWIISSRCRKLKSKRRELCRKSAARRRDSHNALANRIIAQGTDIRVEDMRIAALTKRSKKTTKNKVNGKAVSKKRFGKTVMSRAPASLIAAIDRKLSYAGLSVRKTDTKNVKASQYDHKDNTYKKKPLSQRWHVFSDGTKAQRDMYSAFLIKNTNDTLDGIDRKACTAGFGTFKKLHDQMIVQLLNQNISNTLRWYIA